MSGDTIFPGGIDTAYGTEAAYASGFWDDIDGAGTDVSAWMRRVESATIQAQTYFPRVLGHVAGGTPISNSSAAASLLASTITVPANLMRAGSMLEVHAEGYVIINNTTTTAVTLIPKLGSTTLINIASAPASGTWTLSATAHLWTCDLTISANTTGATADVKTILASWAITQTTASDADGSAGAAYRFNGMGGSTIDLTTNQAFDIQGQMSVASTANVMAGQYCVVKYVPYIG